MEERGREREDILAQYAAQVKPMQDAYVAPTKAHAHLVVEMEACTKVNGLKLEMQPVIEYLEQAGLGGDLAYGQAMRLLAKPTNHVEMRGHDGVAFMPT